MFSEKHKILGDYFHTVLSQIYLFYILQEPLWSSNFKAPNSNKVLHWWRHRGHLIVTKFYREDFSQKKKKKNWTTHLGGHTQGISPGTPSLEF